MLPCTEREGTPQCTSSLPGFSVLCAKVPSVLASWPSSDALGREVRDLVMKLKGGGTCAHAHSVAFCYRSLPCPNPCRTRGITGLHPLPQMWKLEHGELLSFECSKVPFHILIVSFFFPRSMRVRFKAHIMVTKNILECVVLWWLRASSWPTKS